MTRPNAKRWLRVAADGITEALKLTELALQLRIAVPESKYALRYTERDLPITVFIWSDSRFDDARFIAVKMDEWRAWLFVWIERPSLPVMSVRHSGDSADPPRA